MARRIATVALLACLPVGAGAQAEVTQGDGVRASIAAEFSPHRLPRAKAVQVVVAMSGRLRAVGSATMPRLEQISVAINSHGVLRPDAQPRCPLSRIAAATSSDALASCQAALVGSGRFTADVKIPAQAPFPSRGRLLAFNGMYRGSPAILAHIYGAEPFPTSYVLPFRIQRTSGAYGTRLIGSLPRVTGEWGYVTGISLDLGRPSRHPSRPAFIAASCPAPRGLRKAVFPLARTTFAFAGGLSLSATSIQACTVR